MDTAGRDSALIAHECPQGGMHVLSDAVILELLDPEGRPVAPGEPGEIVITDLNSHEAPFIRYATGDIAVMSSRRCPCGRALPLLERIGRALERFHRGARWQDHQLASADLLRSAKSKGWNASGSARRRSIVSTCKWFAVPTLLAMRKTASAAIGRSFSGRLFP